MIEFKNLKKRKKGFKATGSQKKKGRKRPGMEISTLLHQSSVKYELFDPFYTFEKKKTEENKRNPLNIPKIVPFDIQIKDKKKIKFFFFSLKRFHRSK